MNTETNLSPPPRSTLKKVKVKRSPCFADTFVESIVPDRKVTSEDTLCEHMPLKNNESIRKTDHLETFDLLKFS